MSELEELASTLEATGNYKVLRKLSGLKPKEAEGQVFNALFVDTETTGLDVEKDEVIELCMYPFEFTSAGLITAFHPPLHQYNQPSTAITNEITELTGITDEMVGGQTFNKEAIENTLAYVDLVVAHHAGFDRPICERVSKAFEKARWGCSFEHVPWKGGRKLEYIISNLGYFYEAHNAIADCEAALFALQAQVEGKPALAHVIAGCKASWHVWAIKAPFDSKDLLKARKYFWNAGEDGRPKAWHKEIADKDRAAEEEWLRSIYGNAPYQVRFDPVTARERFTKRG